MISNVSKQHSELTVVTKAKELCKYILTVTEKSPKKFRFTLVSKMQNLALDMIECIYIANEVFIKDATPQTIQLRIDQQRDALTKIKLIAYMAHLACEQKCILLKHYQNISVLAHDCQNLLAAWIKSSQKAKAAQAQPRQF